LAVEGPIGGPDEGVGIAAVLGQAGHAQAGRDLLVEVGHIDRLDRGPDLLSHQPGLLLAGVGEQDQELLDAVAADEVALAQRGAHGRGHRGQDLVAAAVAVGVVDVLEVVQVEQDRRQRRHGPAGLGDHPPLGGLPGVVDQHRADHLAPDEQRLAGLDLLQAAAYLAGQQRLALQAALVDPPGPHGQARAGLGPLEGGGEGQSGSTGVAASSRSALLLRFSTVTWLPGMVRSRSRLSRSWASASVSLRCMVSANSAWAASWSRWRSRRPTIRSRARPSSPTSSPPRGDSPSPSWPPATRPANAEYDRRRGTRFRVRAMATASQTRAAAADSSRKRDLAAA
jgi:hypothetical protein